VAFVSVLQPFAELFGESLLLLGEFEVVADVGVTSGLGFVDSGRW